MVPGHRNGLDNIIQELRMASTVVEEPAVAGPPVRTELEDVIAILRLNQPGKPVNVISAALVEEMNHILGELERDEGSSIRAAVIISEKKGRWTAGPHIEHFKDFRTAADGEPASRAGQELLTRLENLLIPTVAAI